MSAYYNEFEPYAAEWLRNVIKEGLIADGEVDSRSIIDVRPDDLRGFTQCHFFAGIGVWSYALRLAGWPDDRPVWTGSCPCQPFSAAGKGKGFEDERHLWPVFHRLIAECSPPVVFGEQVASKDGLQWLDTVFADLEASGYAAGAVDMCAAGIGAPHIRQRLWFVGERLADAASSGSGTGLRDSGADEQRRHLVADGIGDGGLADALRGGTGYDTGEGVGAEATSNGKDGSVPGERLRTGVEGALCRLADSIGDGRRAGRDRDHAGDDRNQPDAGCSNDRPSPTNGHWRDADWLHCRDGKWRPVEPGTFPLAHGAPARVGRLRAYGNAIVPQAAAEVIAAFMEARP